MRSLPLVLLAAVALVPAAIAAPTVKVVHVVEHASTDAVTDTGKKGDSVGDLLTFANALYDADDAKKVGSDNGFCVRTVAGSAWECWWTASLKGGQVTVEGPFYDKRNSVLAITGGTGVYAGARGFMELKSKANGTKYDFVYHLA
jgi:allene oxide cyclase